MPRPWLESLIQEAQSALQSLGVAVSGDCLPSWLWSHLGTDNSRWLADTANPMAWPLRSFNKGTPTYSPGQMPCPGVGISLGVGSTALVRLSQL